MRRLPARLRRVATGIALGISLLAPMAEADTPVPPDVQTWLASGTNGSIEASASGDLTGRRTHDWAGLVDVMLPGDDERRISRLVVFVEQPDGHLRLAAQSAAQPHDCGTARCEWGDVRIAKQSIFVDRHFGWHGCSLEITLQFKARGEHWPLVGEVSDSTDVPWGLDAKGQEQDGPTYAVHVDHNHLTGDVIAREKIATRRARTIRTRVPLRSADLENFDDFTEPSDPGVPEHCGH